MSPSFIPALGESVQVIVPEWHATPGSGVLQLRFYAFLDHEQYQQFKHHGMRVQLWSDIPNGASKEGEWGEMDFTEDLSAAGGALAPSDYPAEGQSGKNILSLLASIPFSVGLSSRLFSFTYRFVYSSGVERWLGTFGHDGRLSFDTASNAGSSFVLEEGWTENNLLWDTRERLVENLRAAKIIHPGDWAIWSLGKDSFLGNFVNSSLVFLVPRARPFDILCPRTIVLSASPDASLSLTPSGEIQVSGSGSLLLQTCDPFGSVDSLIVRALAHCSITNYRYFSVSDNHIVLALSPTVSPVQVVVIPFGPSVHWISQIRIDSATFTDILGTKTSQFTVFSSANSSVHFLDAETANRGATFICAPSSGGQFIVSPVYTFPMSDAGSGADLRLSLLSPHSVSTQGAVNIILPTPPPSPQLRPIAHLSPRPSGLNDSSQSISDMGIPSRRASPDLTLQSESSSVLTVRPGLSGRRSSASLVESYRENNTYLVLAFMKHVYLMVALWFSLVFHKCFGALIKDSTEDREQNQPHPPEAEEVAGTDSFSPVDERTPLLTHASANYPTAQQTATSSTAQESMGSHSTFIPETAELLPKQALAALIFDLLESTTNHTMIVYDASGTISSERLAEQITVAIDGKAVELISVKAINSNCSLLELACTQPGKLQVRYKV